MTISKERNQDKKQKKSRSLKYGFKTSAERHAEDFRRRLAIKNSEPLPYLDLANHLGIEILALQNLPGANPDFVQALLYTEKSDHWSGFFIRQNEYDLIVYNSSHSQTRIASTIMHECAHFILKHPLAPINLNSEIPRNDYPKEQEDEAEWLSGCLLLPKAALMKYYIYQKQISQQIADFFGVSEQMVNYRIGVSGVQTIKMRMGK